MDEKWLDKDGTHSKKMVPGLRALQWERNFRIGVKSEGPELDLALDEIVDQYFGSGNREGDGASVILKGFKKHVKSSIHSFLGNTNGGAQDEDKFFIFVKHHAIIRIDVKLWRYNFNTKHVFAGADNVMAFLFSTSVVEHSKLSVDELTYLLSEHSGDQEIEGYVEELLRVWRKMHSIKNRIDKYVRHDRDEVVDDRRSKYPRSGPLNPAYPPWSYQEGGGYRPRT
jgi:hypothetical protein